MRRTGGSWLRACKGSSRVCTLSFGPLDGGLEDGILHAVVNSGGFCPLDCVLEDIWRLWREQ